MTRLPKLGRIYIVEYFLHVLKTISDEGATFSQLQTSLIAFRENRYQRKFGQLAGYRGDGDRTTARRYELAVILRDLLQELAGYGLIRLTYTTPDGGLTELPPRGRRKGSIYSCYLTPEGKALLAPAETNEERFYDEFLRLMLRALPQFVGFLVGVHRENEVGNFVIVPRPTPEKLGVGGLDLGVADGQRRYVEASVADAAQSVEHWMERAVDREALAAFIEERLERFLERRTNPRRKSIIDNITDSCTLYFLQDFFGDLFGGVTDFQVLCSRGAYLEVLGYSDYIPSVNGRVVYLTSWASPHMELPADFPENEYDDLAVNTDGDQLIIKRHRPHYADFAPTFLDALLAVYKQFNKTRRTVYVPIPDLRDVVCLKLKISNKTFDRLAAQATRESIARQIPYVISLESDEISYDRSLDRFDRSPLYLSPGSAPKTIACVYAR